jgi:signal transduction histidine kinase
MRALDLAERGSDTWIIGWVSTLIGGLHESLRDFEKALHYHVRSYQIFLKVGEPIGEARTLIGIASTHRALGDSTQALDCLNRSLAVFREIGNRIGEARALHDIAVVYQDQGREDEAIQLHLQSLRLREEAENRSAAATSLLSLGRLYLKRGDYWNALSAVQNALESCLEVGANPKAYQAHQLLSQIYEQLGDLALALHHERAFHRIREEVFNEESSTRIRNLQTSLETERSHREAEMHRQRSAELKVKNDELARLLDELQATQMQLVHNEKMASLGGLVAALVHEINSPLGTIQSSCDLSQRLSERIGKFAGTESAADPALANVLDAFNNSQQLMARGVRRIAEIVGNLKSFAHLDGAEHAEIDLNSALDGVIGLLQPQIQSGVRIRKEYEDVPRFPCHVAELNQVFMILLENAVQAIDGEGVVTISTTADERELRVRFADTGRGIPASLLPRIFDAGIRTTGSRARASVSLFTSLHIVRKHGGTIEVQSEPGKGSVFTVRLPQNGTGAPLV